MPCVMITQNEVTSQVPEVAVAPASALLQLLATSPHRSGQAEQEAVAGASEKVAAVTEIRFREEKGE